MAKRILLINHHLYQDGDTFGLMFAMQAGLEVKLGSYDEIWALFWIDADQLANADYWQKVNRRINYFKSFGGVYQRLLGVRCRFSGETKSFRYTKTPIPRAIQVRVPKVVKDGKDVFNQNPRKLSMFLTGGENPIGDAKVLKTLELNTPLDDGPWQSFLNFVPALPGVPKAGGSALRTGFRALIMQKLGLGDGDELSFDYISRSTALMAGAVKQQGFPWVSELIRSAMRRSGSDAAKQYVDTFMQDVVSHYRAKPRFSSAQAQESLNTRDGDFLVVLFWIRGPKDDELTALTEPGASKSEGKPQHHTNRLLYKLVRQIVAAEANNLQRPIVLVPIGDELGEFQAETSQLEVVKAQRSWNLIKFFKRAEFADKPMGEQLRFLTELADEYQVMQIGMRSGAMERLMMAGVPTVYFDRTVSVDNLDEPVGAERIRQLCAFQGTTLLELERFFAELTRKLDGTQGGRPGGFPLLFQIENRDTGWLSYADMTENDAARNPKVARVVEALLNRVTLAEFRKVNRGADLASVCRAYLAKTLSEQRLIDAVTAGSLGPEPAQMLAAIIWFTAIIYPAYRQVLKNQPKPTFSGLGNTTIGQRVWQIRTTDEATEAAKAEQRGKPQDGDDAFDGMFGLFD